MTKETIQELYDQHESAAAVARTLGVNPKTVLNNLKKHGIKCKVGSQGARKHRFNEDYFKLIDSQDKAYWLGFLMADGCVYKGSDEHSMRLQINLQLRDIKHLESFQKSIGSNYKIQEKSVGNSEAALLKVNSTQMCEDLISHGMIRRKTLRVEYPNIEDKFNSHFIRGYFDGDGCISGNLKKRKMCIVGGRCMLDAIKDILPLKTCIYDIKGTEAVSLSTSKKDSVSEFMKYIYDDAELFLYRKKEKFYSLII